MLGPHLGFHEGQQRADSTLLHDQRVHFWNSGQVAQGGCTSALGVGVPCVAQADERWHCLLLHNRSGHPRVVRQVAQENGHSVLHDLVGHLGQLDNGRHLKRAL